MPELDPTFAALPLRAMAAAALSRARELGAEHADFRCERVRNQRLMLRDGAVESNADMTDSGISVRVVHDGTWGFASGDALPPAAAAALADRAVEAARICRPVNHEPIVLAD